MLGIALSMKVLNVGIISQRCLQDLPVVGDRGYGTRSAGAAVPGRGAGAQGGGCGSASPGAVRAHHLRLLLQAPSRCSLSPLSFVSTIRSCTSCLIYPGGSATATVCVWGSMSQPINKPCCALHGCNGRYQALQPVMRLNTRVLLQFRSKPSLHSSAATCQPQPRGCAPPRELCGIIQVWIELGSIHLATVSRHANDPAHPVFMVSKEMSACRRALGPCPGAAVLQRGLPRKAGAPSPAHRGAAAAAARPGRRGGAPRLVGGSLHCGTDWPGLCHLGSDPTSPHTG